VESSTRQIRLARLRPLALLAVVLITFICVHRAAADTTPGFIGAPSQTTLAPWASSKDVAILASDCGSADSCVATGYYADSADRYSPLVVPIVDGSSSSGSEVSLPADADTTGQQASLGGVSCWDPGWCVAVGDYFNSSRNSQALAVPIGYNQPGSGASVSLPGDASASPVSDLTSVSCVVAGSCVAAGSYLDATGNTRALIVPISAATAGTGVEVDPPAGSAASGSQVAQLSDVACWSAGTCVAVGFFKDAHGDNQAFVVPVTNGVPGAAVAVSPPADAAVSGSSTVPDATLAKVSCWNAGSCVAVGSYATAANNVEGLVVPITNGVPGAAASALLPSNAATANSTQNASLTDVSCTEDGECAAVGDYLVSPIDQEPLLEQISNGVASAGQDVSLPADAGVGRQTAELTSVSCPATGACAAAGSYTDYLGDPRELTVPVSEGIASAGSAPPGFANESFPYPYTQLTSVSCSSSDSCVALGTYANTSGVQVPTVFSMQAPIAIDTPNVPSTRKGTSYQATLSASGAWGSYSWSLSSGSLPAGLSLNSQTGEISGIPSTTGSSTFTVQVSATGAPLQTATQQLSIIVAAARRPFVSLPHGSLQVSANHLDLQVGCVGSTCNGAVTLQATEVVTVKVKVAFNVKTRIRVKVKVKGKKKGKHKPKYRFRTKLVRKYRMELVHRSRTDMIGRRSFSLAAGANDDVTVTLDPTGRRLLARAKGHRLSTRMSVVVAAGNQIVRQPTLLGHQ
jgi:Putative Ig domain